MSTPEQSNRELREQAAFETLDRLGYTYDRGLGWLPPRGKVQESHEGGYAGAGKLSEPVSPVGELSQPTIDVIEKMGEVFARTAARVLQDVVTPVQTITITPEMAADPAITDRLAKAFRSAKQGSAATIYPRPEGEHIARDGYEYAFYKLAELLDLGAQPIPPSEVFEQQMYPMIKEALEKAKQPIRWFRMQHGPHIPWEVAEVLYAGYASAYGTSQTIERMNERGGFGWGEVQGIMKDRPAVVRAMQDKAKALGIGFSQ